MELLLTETLWIPQKSLSSLLGRYQYHSCTTLLHYPLMEDILMDDLFNGEREVQIRAANELENLSSRQKHKLVERGIIEPLISMLHSEDHGVIESALQSLLSLAYGSERNKNRIVNSGIIPVLLELLQCQEPLLIELVVAAMLILSSCTANKPVIAVSGAIQQLIAVLNGDFADDHDSYNGISIQAKLDAIVTIHNLSTCHEIILPIVSSGVTHCLLQLIHSSEKSSELAEKAVALLENILSLSENELEEITATNSSAIQDLVEMIEDGSPQSKEHAVAILLLLCKTCRDKYRSLILREGVMPGLLQLNVDGTWRAKSMARELLLLLRDSSSESSRGGHSKHELVEQIMQEINAEGDIVVATKRLVEGIAKLSTQS